MPQATIPPRGPKPTTKPRAPLSRGAIIILVCGIAAIFVGGMFLQDIKGAIALKAWSKGEVRQVVASFTEALKKADPTQVKQWVDEEYILIIEDSGRLTALRGGPTASNPPAPVPIEQLICSDGATAKITYAPSAQPHPTATVALTGPDGGPVELVLNRLHGSYRVEYFLVRGGR